MHIIPSALGPHLAVITGVLSLPFTFFMSNDAFYFGIMPVLAEAASTYGIEPVEMARASITGQTFHMQSPLVPAILLLVTLAGVSLADHHKKVLWRAALVSLSMLVIGVVLGHIPCDPYRTCQSALETRGVPMNHEPGGVEPAPEGHGPLHGIRVLDISTVYAAPITAMLLGDYGADVIKVEHPVGDPARSHGANKDGHGLWWKVISRNKKCVTLNFGTPGGQQILRFS